MQFVYPGFLWALTLIAIPVIIHLFYFRRYRQVLFSNVRFLKEVKEETSARNKLRNLLILLMRMLALTFLILAFAQPFIPGSSQREEGIQHVSIFIDNSFSMSSFGTEFSLLDQTRQRAMEIVRAYSIDDAFQILTQELSGSEHRTISQEEALARIEDIDISPERVSLGQVYERQKLWLEAEDAEQANAFWISDFQANTLGETFEADSLIDLQVLPLKAVRSANLLIDSCWLLSPVQMLNETAQLLVRIKNYSDQPVEQVVLSLEVNEQEKPLGTVSVPAGKVVIDTASITILKTGWHRVVARLTDFPVQFDDSYYLSFYVDEEIRVLSIFSGTPNQSVEAAFQNRNFFKLNQQPAGALNYTAFPDYDLIILENVSNISSGFSEALRTYLNSGGKVLVFPPALADLESYNRFLRTIPADALGSFQEKERTIGTINTEEFIFSDVFETLPRNLRLPSIQGSYTLDEMQTRASETLLAFRDGSSFLNKYVAGKGFLYLAVAPLENTYSQLTRHAEIFVPLLYKAAIARNESQSHAYIIGEDRIIEVENRLFDGESVYEMTGPKVFIPGMQLLGNRALLDVNEQITEAGFYNLRLKDTLQAVFAFNYNRLESDLAVLDKSELENILGEGVRFWEAAALTNMTEAIKAETLGKRLWKWCIIFALIFLALETGVIRFWKQ